MTRVQAWFERGWVLGLALFVFVLHLPYLWPGGPARRHTGLQLVFDHDEATVFYDAYRVALGEVPYRDFFNFKGPVFGLVHGLGFWFGGGHWELGQLLWLLYDAVSMAFLAAIVGRLAGRGFAFFAVCFHACVVVLVWPRPYEQWLAISLILAAIYLFVRSGEMERRWTVVVGVLLGLASMTALSMGAPVAIAAVGLAFLRGLELRPLRLRPAFKAAAALGGGVVLGGFFALLPTILHGALRAMYQQTILWPARSYVGAQPSVYGDGRTAIVKKLVDLDFIFPRIAGEGFINLVYALPIVLAGVVALALLSPFGARWLGSVRNRPSFWVVLLAGAGTAHLLLGGMNRDITHLSFVGAYGLLGLAGAASVLQSLGPRIRRSLQIAGAVLGLCCLGFYGFVLVRSWEGSRAMGTWREASLALFPYPETLETLRPEDTIVFGSFAPGYVYFHVRPSAIPITNFPLSPKRWLGYYDQAQYQWIADSVLSHKPMLLALSGEQWDFLRLLTPDLAKLYERVPNSRRGYVELWRRQPPAVLK